MIINAKLVQFENINCGGSHPIDKPMTVEKARDLYGSQIEGETITIYDVNDNRYSWEYKNGKYQERG